jgi:hypothetical protein
MQRIDGRAGASQQMQERFRDSGEEQSVDGEHDHRAQHRGSKDTG